MRQLSLINAIVGSVFPVPASRFCSNRKKTHYPNQKAPLPNFDNLSWGWKPITKVVTAKQQHNHSYYYNNTRLFSSVAILLTLAQIPLGSTRLDSTHSTCRAHAFWLCRASRRAQLDLLDTSTSTGSTRRTRLARLARHVELDRRYLQLSYDHRNSFINKLFTD